MSDAIVRAIREALSRYQDPYLKRDHITAKTVDNIQFNDGCAEITMTLGFPADGYIQTLRHALEACCLSVQGVQTVKWRVATVIKGRAIQPGLAPLKGVKNVIAIASGKGGVGKSTTAVNLALALQHEGARVGILDADIYGPSQPRMLGAKTRPEVNASQRLNPVVSHGVQSMSIGYLVDEDTPMVWRGPMVSTAIQQLANDTDWSDLDYLIVDMPPGTGDIHLTLSQKVPLSGAVIVTTPQDISLLDARKGVAMFQKVNVSVLGVIENMSLHQCSQCGHTEAIFGEGGGLQLSVECGVPLLGQLPLDIRIRTETDQGTPTVAKDPESNIAQHYIEIARTMTAQLSLKAKDYSNAFPNIVVENT